MAAAARLIGGPCTARTAIPQVCGSAALRAYIRLAARLNRVEEAEKYSRILQKALKSFDKHLWNAPGKFYRVYHDEKAAGADHEVLHEGCHSGQLAGQWYADFLMLGELFPEEQVKAALDALFWSNEKPWGVSEAYMPDGSACVNPPSIAEKPNVEKCWHGLALAHYACLQIAHGQADRGLRAIQKMYEHIHVARGRSFNQPLWWDTAPEGEESDFLERHTSSLSVWHLLYALAGFQLNVPDQILWIRPHLPRGVFSLNVPLFTPVCQGWLRFVETAEGPYRQEVQVSLDSPILIRS